MSDLLIFLLIMSTNLAENAKKNCLLSLVFLSSNSLIMAKVMETMTTNQSKYSVRMHAPISYIVKVGKTTILTSIVIVSC